MHRSNARRVRYDRGMMSLALLALLSAPLEYDDPAPALHKHTLRASDLDRRARAYPDIGFYLEKDGKPADQQQAWVDTRVPSRGKLVVWLMAPNGNLFDRITSYGMHVVQPHYARHWFGTLCQENPVGPMCRGNVRLEAATGEDHSDQVNILKPDGMAERTRRMIVALAKSHPEQGWGHFLAKGQLRWDDVIVAGSSHGSTTAARFAKHQQVSRVVMFCGPRDQLQQWQSLPSATPANRYFGFSHVEDMGWKRDHYCRSWELLGLHEFGPIVNVDDTAAPFGDSRRLVTDFDVGGSEKRAHSGVTPGGSAAKLGDAYRHEAVWEYLFTHPVDEVGEPVPMDDDCDKDQRD